jgi:hypothetical protein
MGVGQQPGTQDFSGAGPVHRNAAGAVGAGGGGLGMGGAAFPGRGVGFAVLMVVQGHSFFCRGRAGPDGGTHQCGQEQGRELGLGSGHRISFQDQNIKLRNSTKIISWKTNTRKEKLQQIDCSLKLENRNHTFRESQKKVKKSLTF